MFSRARVAAACSAALVLITVCALVALRDAASAQTGLATAPAAVEASAASCDDRCRLAGWANGYIFGTAPLCGGFCYDCDQGGYGYGMVIGTAPACQADCVADCDGACSVSTDFFSDHGNSCLSGAKRCCCARAGPVAKPTPRMPDHPTCNDWCLSAGYARGDMKGTAPFCGGRCDNAPACFTATHMLSGYGKSCMVGSKKCRCWQSDAEPAGGNGESVPNRTVPNRTDE
ncbi:hypothetical protein KFE25_003583 [Diacronema lutheri]|uniref:Uncharacterized protein n=1 Tax=Diacronema lutheri TaxID=2081491 RepID=A0A8J6C4H1_DIALT|nr:hypothetical protein KFE25_003583 [Diacronema lutheri]